MNISEHLWFSAEHYWQAANRQRPWKKPKNFFSILMLKRREIEDFRITFNGLFWKILKIWFFRNLYFLLIPCQKTFYFSGTSRTANLVLCFWTVYRGLSWILPWACAHRQLPCRSFFRTFLIFGVVGCFGFLMCNGGWLLCIAIIMTSDFLLDLMLCRNFDGIVFCRSCHWNCCGELSSKMFSNVVFFNQFLEFFAQMWCKNRTLSDVKLHLFLVSVK